MGTLMGCEVGRGGVWWWTTRVAGCWGVMSSSLLGGGWPGQCQSRLDWFGDGANPVAGGPAGGAAGPVVGQSGAAVRVAGRAAAAADRLRAAAAAGDAAAGPDSGAPAGRR